MKRTSIFRSLILASFLFTGTTGIATAQPRIANSATVSQDGAGNAGAVTQNGQANQALIAQYGYNHSATIRQDGYGNAACIIQSGAGHQGAITQSGDFNGVGLVQNNLRSRIIPADQCGRINARRAAQAAAQQRAARNSGIRR